MTNLFIVNEILTNKYSIEVLYVLYIFIILCGIYIIISKRDKDSNILNKTIEARTYTIV